MLNHLEPYLLMPSALTPTALLERAEAIAATVTNDTHLGAGPVRIRHTPLYDAWLVPWEPGAATALHTHDGAHGAYVALSGEFQETIASESGVRERVVAAGEKVAFRPEYTHRLTATGPAMSLHLFSPPRAAGPCAPAPVEEPALAAL
jgi:quercetin dioxygenase-like cupin family protein